ncbi:hypothetical protein ACJMK2_023878 [Sinanodonta woodiana]|uniref:1-phosphatidylinositol-5-phosphate 4-kinase n=2 Tax=Sinanodonta woodiana TaxID=1069815 RepID=A0ABD3T7B8_SINWO
MATAKRKQIKVKTVQQKKRLFRSKEPLFSVFMWGINHTVNELGHVNIPVMLMPDDFKAYTKVRIDNHLFNKDNMPSHFKMKEYCPFVFRNLRERFGLDENEYLNSLTTRLVDIDSPGRSGARMLMSQDYRFFIKTLVSEEVEQMHHLLKQYHQYIVENRAETRLPQYLGMYRVTVNDVETYLIVMKNVFSPRLPIHKKYDLKGSTVDRHASDKEKSKELPTYKDNDFLNDGARIHIGPIEKEKLLATIGRDVEFLTSLHLMDYSLIVGIHDRERGDQETKQNLLEEEEDVEVEQENGYDVEGGELGDIASFVPTPPESPQLFNSPFEGDLDPKTERYGVKSAEDAPRKEIYFMALIDILTRYSMKKRTAQAAKTMKHGAGAEISTVKPDQYAKRFMDFISKCIE